MRSAATGILLVLSSTLLVVPLGGPAAAAPARCQGLDATIVGSGRSIVGTDGPDVIVTNGAFDVDAGAGDDHVCVTGDSGRVRVELGLGSDEYDGGPMSDYVWTGRSLDDPAAAGSRDPAEDVDVVRTGAGNDWVIAGGEFFGAVQGPGESNADRIDLGRGRDRVEIHGSAPAGRAPVVDGGPGRDSYRDIDVRPAAPAADTVDARSGEVRHGKRVLMRFRSFEVFGPGLDTGEPLRLLGGPRAEEFVARALPPGSVVRAGAGEDVVVLSPRDPVDTSGGAGDDTLVVEGLRGSPVSVDLAAGRLASSGMRSRIGSFEAVDVRDAGAVAARGSAGPDRITIGCPTRARVDAGGGDDVVLVGPGCRDRQVSLRGGPGDDRLVGGSATAVLRGGPGRDRCVQGRRIACEW